MGLFSSKPKIKIQATKKDGFSGWLKCSSCNELIHMNELKENLYCCPKCSYHFRLSASQRIEFLIDKNTFEELFINYKPLDPLNFVDTEAYSERIKKAQSKSGKNDAVVVGTGKIDGTLLAIGVLDFGFMGGSMGSVVGEKLCLLIEKAQKEGLPLVIVSASGGARMQESTLSLMQMAKTSAALARYAKSSLPYISVLTNPTTGGVTASFATLGDVILAEPQALIGFAGPRVVEQTTREKLPPDAQKSEFLLGKGMIDCIVSRHNLKNKLSILIKFLAKQAQKEAREENLPDKLQEILKLSQQKKASKMR